MIVFDLRCAGAHVFEAWFASSEAYETQRAQAMIECPFCGSIEIAKAVMAPHVGAKGNRRAEPAPEQAKNAIAELAAAQARMLENSEWVGTAFADRARAMHQGEEDPAPIHGQATADEARALADEGVPVAPLPLPVVPPEARN